LEKVAKSPSCVEVHKALLSWAERVMMGFAVPDRRKSASFTELMKESWRTTGEASGIAGLSGSGVKCKVSLNGRVVADRLSGLRPAS
jgi:hypothetical protein